jgi:hypothetical protein
VLKQLIDKLNSQQVQLLYVKDLSEKLHRQSSLDKHYDQRLVFLEQLTTQQTKQLQEIKMDQKKQEASIKLNIEKHQCKSVIVIIIEAVERKHSDEMVKML